jgi:putative hydrolase of the HAD superfamily
MGKMKSTEITCLFLDIGGVLLSNGWDHHARKRAATIFKLESAEMEDRHHLTSSFGLEVAECAENHP